MKIIKSILFFVFCVAFVFANSQEDSAKLNDSDEVFLIVEQMPVFGDCEEPQGHAFFENYHRHSSPCSLSNIDAFLKGEVAKIRSNYSPKYMNVLVQFVIDKTGKMVDPKLVHSSGNEEVDAVGLEIVQKMQEWQPGTQRGIAVSVQYTIPVIFDKL